MTPPLAPRLALAGQVLGHLAADARRDNLGDPLKPQQVEGLVSEALALADALLRRAATPSPTYTLPLYPWTSPP